MKQNKFVYAQKIAAGVALVGVLIFALLSNAIPLTAQETTNSRQIARITSTGASVNLRSGPGETFSVIVSVPNNAEVVVLETRDNWIHIQLEDGSEGWVASFLLTILPTPTPSPTAATTATIEATATPSAESFFDDGLRNLLDENYEQAIESFSVAIELDPDYAFVYFNRGRAYYGLGKYEEALADFTLAIEHNPENRLMYDNRAAVYIALDNFEQALADYNVAIERDPNFVMSYIKRGYLYHLMGESESAIQDYDRAIELDPENGYVYGWRGLALVATNSRDTDQIRADFCQHVRLVGDDAYEGAIEWLTDEGSVADCFETADE